MGRTKQTARKRKNNQTGETKTSDSNEASNAKQQKVAPVLKLSSGEPITESPILPNTKGFLISFGDTRQYCKIVEDSLRLLNEYANKLYRSDGKTCYFEHKLANKPGYPPIFIETDMENPAVLVDAILEDLNTPSFDFKDMDFKCWSRFVPVNVTCNAIAEEIIEKAKDILQPLFQNPEETKIPRVEQMINIKRLKIESLGVVQAELKKYLQAQVDTIAKPAEGDVECMKATLALQNYNGVCCMSLLKTLNTNSIVEIMKNKKKSETTVEVNEEGEKVQHPAKDVKDPGEPNGNGEATVEATNNSKGDEKNLD